VDGALALERLEAKLLGDEDGDNAAAATLAVPATAERSPPSTSRIPSASASQSPSMRGGCVAHGPGHIPRPVAPTRDEGTPSPIVHRSQENKLEVSHGKRKS